MTRHRRRDKLRRSHFYTFGFHRGKSRPHSLEGDGYTRIVYCNQPDIHEQHNLSYHKNTISTTKYNVITFFPKALFEQFRRVANLYFLAAACLSLTPISPFGPVSQILPLVFVVGLSMAKEALEDWNRFLQDTEVNSRKVFVHQGDGIFRPREWQKVRVGDSVKVEKDQFFPADLLLLSSSYEDGICYVETMNLDGETNLKVKRSLEITMPIDNDEAFRDFSGVIKCENPNPSLYTFIGNFEYKDQVYSLDPSQILLRDSKLRNTDYVYGVVIYTGHDSKVMQNSTKAPSKRSTIEKKLDTIMYFLFALLLLVSLISSIGCLRITIHEEVNWWYNSDDANTNNPALAVFLHYVTCLILYGYLIPISLYVSIEIVKVLQVTFINQDLQMFDDEKGLPVKARTSNLNEDLGQVHTILSDKTGTLTCNQMDFLKCSIAGVAYGVQASEVEIAAEKQMACELEEEEKDSVSNFPWCKNIEALENINRVTHHETDSEGSNVTVRSHEKDKKKTIKGFSFEDERLTSGKWSKETNAEVYWLYFRILAVCHTAIPDIDEETGAIRYEAESPDEGAFLLAAKEFGFEFCKRTQSSVFVQERHSDSGCEPVERQYQILNVLDFTSKRKRMSVIVRDEKGSLFLFCKGADTIIFDRLSKNGGTYLEATTRHLNEYGEGGLRTLVLAYKELDEKEYSVWNDEFHKAKTTVGSERDAMLEKLSEEMENDLILVGATAVEDKLQKGVPRCIDKLAQAGIKIWVLTGDKMETAINIGYACSLLREGMKILTLTALNSESKFAYGNGEIKEDLSDQITKASQKIKFEDDPQAAFALIVDGKTLTYALEEDMKKKFLDLAIECASVICCRVSPKQKALVTRLVKEGTHKITLAIGDGANDVGMIQEADIGVGISGFEGMQAVMASDFAIAQFRFLERLLLVHGHWCYKRMAKMICYFFYKNITFALTLLYFEAYAGFSGQSVYSGLYMTMFNLILTSFPVITLGVFEQDVSPEVCLQFPTLYKQGSNNMFFNWHSISGWMMNGIYCSIVIFFLNLKILFDQSIHVEGKTADMSSIGTAIFTSIIWVVNCQIALLINHFIWIQVFFVSGSIAIWYIFLVIDGMLPPKLSGDVYEIFVEVLGPAVAFWAATLLVTLTCNLPYLLHISFQRYFNPMDHHIIQEIKFYKRDIHDRHMWTRELSKSTRETKIGFTARVQEKKRQYKEKTQKKKSSLGMLKMCTGTHRD